MQIAKKKFISELEGISIFKEKLIHINQYTKRCLIPLILSKLSAFGLVVVMDEKKWDSRRHKRRV